MSFVNLPKHQIVEYITADTFKGIYEKISEFLVKNPNYELIHTETKNRESNLYECIAIFKVRML